MLCDCGKQLIIGVLLTKLGNDIEYTECESCGVVDVMGMDVEDAE